MSSFFKSLAAPFRKSSPISLPHRSSQPGPFSTGTNIEAQTPARRRHFWNRDSQKWSSGAATPDAKPEKPARAEKLGTITGVFVPTTLNVMSILMYLRVLSPTQALLTASMGLFWDKQV